MKFSTLFFLFLGCLVVIAGCRDEKSFDQSIQEFSQKVERAAPGLHQKSEELLDRAVNVIDDHVDVKYVKDEIMKTTSFESMKGFYNEYSPFKKDTGSETLDGIIEKTKALRKLRLESGDDASDIAEDVLAISFREKLTEMGLSSTQIDDFMEYIKEMPSTQ